MLLVKLNDAPSKTHTTCCHVCSLFKRVGETFPNTIQKLNVQNYYSQNFLMVRSHNVSCKIFYNSATNAEKNFKSKIFSLISCFFFAIFLLPHKKNSFLKREKTDERKRIRSSFKRLKHFNLDFMSFPPHLT